MLCSRLLHRSSRVAPPLRAAATTRFHTARIPPDHARTPAWKDVEESLSSRLPTFPTRGREHVRVLYEPKEFYRALIDQIQRAKKRIFLASLYVGKEETELVAALHSALRKNPSLRLTFLVDYLRSTREHPNPSSASLLASLSAAFPAQVDLRLFHTPELNGWARKYIPKRFNEGWGLQHMKIYGFDDDVILSGANLSHDYFTNRADRYLHFRSHAPLADYFSSLISLVSSYSYRLTASDTSTPHPAISISWPSDSPFSPSSDPFFHDPRTSIPELKQHAHEALTAFTSSWHSRSPHSLASSLPPFPSPPSSSSSSSSLSPPPPSAALRNPRLPFLSHFDTSLRPVLQMGPFSISHETDLVVPEIFRAANALATAPGGRNTTLDWTSGYFSLREDYKKLVLDCAANVRIVSASPEANGFFGSKGVSRFIPPAYTYFAKKFWDEAQAQARKRGREESHVEMREWKREGWTYHAKGIWLAPCISNPHSPPAHDPSTSFSPSYLPDPHEQDFPLRHLAPSPPFLTLLGSSNYGSRSASRDLEATLLVTTHDKGLRWELERECRRIREFAVERVGRGTWERDERRVPWGVRWAARAIEGML
ncbi:hypothetical protein JCM8547_003449 [Rhodosporidiobolus lusitaniae]